MTRRGISETLASDALQVASAYVSRLVQPEYIRIIYHANGGISSFLTIFDRL